MLEGFTLTLVVVIGLAVAFDYINGFHDTANAIATSVSTRALRPQHAILMAATFNFIGAFAGTAVAKTIGSGLVDDASTTPGGRGGRPRRRDRLEPDHLAARPAELEQPRAHRRPPRRDDHRGRDRRAQAWTGIGDKVLLPLVSSPIIGFVVGVRS